jgi:hypothetical protein
VISISPLSGYKYLTPFTVHISPSATDNLINWGDQSFSQTSTAVHYFSASDVYDVYAGNCVGTSAFSVSVYNGPFLENRISVSAQSVSAYAGCANTFLLNVSSVNPSATVFLYSSGSNSYPYSDDSFWSHLNPRWSFQYEETPVDQIRLALSPVISGGYLLGYVGSSALNYVDDMPGNPNLFFTIEQEEGTNSRIYSSMRTSISADIPLDLAITADGINQLSRTQFGDVEIPYVISVRGVNSCGTIMHYASGAITYSQVLQGCNGIAQSNYVTDLSAINLVDANCFKTGGYLQANLLVPLSAIPSNILQMKYDVDSCGNPTPELAEYSEVQLNPFNVQISAQANIWVANQMYQLTGISNSFDVYRLADFHQFYRKGEDKTVYDLINRYSHWDLSEMPVFNSYLSAIAGPGDTLGKVYDKIQNFNLDMSDPDLCQIDQLVNLGQMLDNPVDDFGLAFPEEMRRLMGMFSMPINKLIGTRCVCNQNFVSCKSCAGTNVCGLCGFDKKSNLGNLIQWDDRIEGGTTVLVRENGGTTYEFYYVPDTTVVRNITAWDINSHCFYQWNSQAQNNPVESVIDYKNPATTISRSLSSAQDWIADDGLIDQILTRVLVNNIIK